jgi:hypothetical protein
MVESSEKSKHTSILNYFIQQMFAMLLIKKGLQNAARPSMPMKMRKIN